MQQFFSLVQANHSLEIHVFCQYKKMYFTVRSTSLKS